MGLVEREVQLAALGSWLAEAAGGEGRLVFVGGEAGAGKSALVGEFCRSLPADVPVYLGACEPLSAPRPLGPLADIAAEPGRGDRRADARRRPQWCLHAPAWARLTAGPAPKVMVIEDAHWADESTLDLLQYLSRRIGSAGRPAGRHLPRRRRPHGPDLAPAGRPGVRAGGAPAGGRRHFRRRRWRSWRSAPTSTRSSCTPRPTGTPSSSPRSCARAPTACRPAWLTRCWPGFAGSARPPGRPSRWPR